jgi:hypothetical protein
LGDNEDRAIKNPKDGYNFDESRKFSKVRKEANSGIIRIAMPQVEISHSLKTGCFQSDGFESAES